MKIQFTLVGDMRRPPNITVDLPAVPAVGDVVNWPGVSQANTVVRTVVWYITEDSEGNRLDEPFAYVVVGPRRNDTQGLQSMHRLP